MEESPGLALPALMGSLCQLQARGSLVLRQADGTRVLHWRAGRLVGVDGEGPSRVRPGDRLRDALAQPLLGFTWEAQEPSVEKGAEGALRVDIWDAFQRMALVRPQASPWRGDEAAHWRGREGLLESLSDLPMTPALAYAVSRMGAEPLTIAALATLAALPMEDAAWLMASLWVLGGVTREEGAPFDPEVAKAPIPSEAESWDPPLRSRGAAIPAAPTEGSPSRAERVADLWLEAQAYAKEGRTSEAIRALEQALRWSGEGRDAYAPWLLLGRLRLGNPAWSHRAMEALRMAARLDPRAAEPWVLMGGLYRAKGLTVNAEGCYRRAQGLDPHVVIPPPEAPDAAVEDAPRMQLALTKVKAWVKARRG